MVEIKFKPDPWNPPPPTVHDLRIMAIERRFARFGRMAAEVETIRAALEINCRPDMELGKRGCQFNPKKSTAENLYSILDTLLKAADAKTENPI